MICFDQFGIRFTYLPKFYHSKWKHQWNEEWIWCIFTDGFIEKPKLSYDLSNYVNRTLTYEDVVCIILFLLTVFWPNGRKLKVENDCPLLKFTLVEITLTRTYSLGQFERKHLKDYWTHIHWFLERFLFLKKKTTIRQLKISDESFS